MTEKSFQSYIEEGILSEAIFRSACHRSVFQCVRIPANANAVDDGLEQYKDLQTKLNHLNVFKIVASGNPCNVSLADDGELISVQKFVDCISHEEHARFDNSESEFIGFVKAIFRAICSHPDCSNVRVRPDVMVLVLETLHNGDIPTTRAILEAFVDPVGQAALPQVANAAVGAVQVLPQVPPPQGVVANAPAAGGPVPVPYRRIQLAASNTNNKNPMATALKRLSSEKRNCADEQAAFEADLRTALNMNPQTSTCRRKRVVKAVMEAVANSQDGQFLEALIPPAGYGQLVDIAKVADVFYNGIFVTY